MRRLLHRQPQLIRSNTNLLASVLSTTWRQRKSFWGSASYNSASFGKVPVILVGNKIDLRGGEVTNEALEEEIIPIMNEFKASTHDIECELES